MNLRFETCLVNVMLLLFSRKGSYLGLSALLLSYDCKTGKASGTLWWLLLKAF